MMCAHKFLCCLSCILFISGCAGGKTNIFDPEKHDLIDQDLGLSREDYKTFTDSSSYKKNGAKTPGAITPPAIPDLAEILAAPKPPKIGATQLVSITVTDDVPLKDVLMQLARLANVDIEVDAGITGGIDFRAKDQPFNEVIDRIASLAGLRYSMKDNVVRIERDTPYVQVYSLNFLNLDRSSQSNVNISTSVLSSSGVSGGSSGGS
ncbi:MAG: DUF4974 domain-containing protein, partial [Pseudomonadota bacterium]|nr:DUF4974 domain-containing protein [Pseudomonadota bacterium]